MLFTSVNLLLWAIVIRASTRASAKFTVTFAIIVGFVAGVTNALEPGRQSPKEQAMYLVGKVCIASLSVVALRKIDSVVLWLLAMVVGTVLYLLGPAMLAAAAR